MGKDKVSTSPGREMVGRRPFSVPWDPDRDPSTCAVASRTLDLQRLVQKKSPRSFYSGVLRKYMCVYVW